MEGAFSSALRLGGLDDFLEPAQECVLPTLRVQPAAEEAGVQPGRHAPRRNLRNQTKLQPEAPAQAARFGSGVEARRTAGQDASEGGARTQSQSAQQQPLEEGRRRVENLSLSDCLSCSGCLTSSEEILLQQQSAGEFLEILRRSGKAPRTIGQCTDTPLSAKTPGEGKSLEENRQSFRFVCVSLSSQSIAAVAQHFGCSAQEAAGRLSFLLRLLGADCVFSMGAVESVALLESLKELLGRWISRGGVLGETEEPTTSIPSVGKALETLLPSSGPLPLLTSFCPGVAVLANKQRELSLEPFLSRVRSAQQLQGLLVKSAVRLALQSLSFFLAYKLGAWKFASKSAVGKASVLQLLLRRSCYHLGGQSATNLTAASAPSDWNVAPSDICHVCVMPCFDKKLEAARPDFAHSSLGEKGVVVGSAEPVDASCFCSSPLAFGEATSSAWREVDRVVATSELDALLAASGSRFEELGTAPLDCVLPGAALAAAAQSLCALKRRHSALELAEEAAAAAAAAATVLPAGPSTALEAPRGSNGEWLQLTRPSQVLAGSGGYLELLFERAALCLFGRETSGQDVEFRVGPNDELQILDLRRLGPSEEEKMLSGAFAYGFRNIQNVSDKMRALVQPSRARGDVRTAAAVKAQQPQNNKWWTGRKRHWSLPHLIEIAACPGGCLNGGGQRLSATPSNNLDASSAAAPPPQKAREVIEPKFLGRGREPLTSVTRIIHSDFEHMRPEAHPLVPSIYLFIFACCYGSQKSDSSMPQHLARVQPLLNDKDLRDLLPPSTRPSVPLGVWLAPAVTATFRSLQGALLSHSKGDAAIRTTSLKW